MNLALPSVVLVVLILPGIVFRVGYLAGRPRSDLSGASRDVDLSVATELIFAIAAAIVLHMLAYWPSSVLASAFGWPRPNLGQFSIFMFGGNSERVQRSFELLQKNLEFVTLYNLVLWTCSAGLGNFCYRLVELLDLDRRVPFLRPYNQWQYIYNGRLFGFRRGEDFYLVQLDALVSDGSRTTLYSGFWAGFQLDNAQVLDCLYLISAKKWVESRQGESARRQWEPVAGDFLMLKYDQVLNLNITYLQPPADPVSKANRDL